MPFKSRDIAFDSWLLMVSAAFVLMGLIGVVQGWRTSAPTLLVPDAALATLLGAAACSPRCSSGGACAWPRVSRCWA